MRCHISRQALSEGIKLFYYVLIISQTCSSLALSLSCTASVISSKPKATSWHLLPVSFCYTKGVWHHCHEVSMATPGCQRLEHPRTTYNLLICDSNTTVNLCLDWLPSQNHANSHFKYLLPSFFNL